MDDGYQILRWINEVFEKTVELFGEIARGGSYLPLHTILSV
jgi:hypothetical protein